MHKSKSFTALRGLRGLIAGGVLATALTMSGCQGKVSDDSIGYLRSGELARWVEKSPEKYLIIDMRTAEEFAAGHIPSARRMSLPDVDPDKPDPALSRYSAIVVYGEDPGSGVARAMTKRLMQSRLSNVYLLEGGMAAWRSSGGAISGPRR